ncbi:YfhJ family protein [Jeotgalibacillus soli]|uniref:WVELL protein n=1 Tax=Jeotgalibacillus soli TaxID=889306 RepID=A0A0C2VTB8_9BACL|nr:YfhJ family protein [Jeotgalibacillus soli]KIL47248.1 hypothetical protein KP78_18210 [Jeotgalibacillus soli]
MKDYHDRLVEQLLEQNNTLSVARARVWVELLWSDFEATYAKAGHEYKGHEMTERVVSQWINNYGPRLHEFASLNPKYVNLLNSDQDPLH